MIVSSERKFSNKSKKKHTKSTRNNDKLGTTISNDRKNKRVGGGKIVRTGFSFKNFRLHVSPKRNEYMANKNKIGG